MRRHDEPDALAHTVEGVDAHKVGVMPANDRTHYRGDYERRAQTIRDQANADPDTRCWRCGYTLRHHRASDTWQAGHLIDGNPNSPLAAEHASCNAKAGGKLGQARARNRWRDASTFITLVVGPPAGGKSTYVEEHAEPGDLVLDYDRLAEALGSPDSHAHGDGQKHAAALSRNAILAALQRGQVEVDHAWILSTNPNAETVFPYHEVVTIDPGPDEAHRRATLDGRPHLWHELIDGWYTARLGRTHAAAVAAGQPNSRRW